LIEHNYRFCAFCSQANFDMSGMSLPVLKSFLQEQASTTTSSNTGDDTLKTILPLMMMMSMRRRSYGGLGTMGGLFGGFGGGLSGPFGMGLGSPYAAMPYGMGMGMGMGTPWPYGNAMFSPLAQAHMLNSNPFLNPTMNPFMGPSTVYEPRN
jgi:hypothetical protein